MEDASDAAMGEGEDAQESQVEGEEGEEEYGEEDSA